MIIQHNTSSILQLKCFNLLSKIIMNCSSKHYQLCITFAWFFWHNLLVLSYRLFDKTFAIFLWVYVGNTYDFTNKFMIFLNHYSTWFVIKFVTKLFIVLSKLVLICFESKHYYLCMTNAWPFWQYLLIFFCHLCCNICNFVMFILCGSLLLYQQN